MRPLTEVGWLRGHRAALYWLSMLYRRPQVLADAAKGLGRAGALGLGLRLYLHGLPYAVILIFALRIVLFELLRLPVDPRSAALGFWGFHLAGLGIGLYFWLALGLVFGLIGELRGGLGGGVAVGLGVGLGVGLAVGLVFGLGLGLVFGLGVGLGVGLSAGLGVGLGFGLGGGLGLGLGLGLVGGLVGGLAVGLGVGLAFPPALLRAYYWPLLWWLTWPKPRGRLYRFHPVAWDDCCPVPYPGLTRMLVAYAGHDRVAAEREIDRLVSSYPAQRKPALRARTILIAEQAAKIARFADLSPLLARLPEGDRGYLAQTARLRSLVQGLVALADRAESSQVPALRAAEASELCLRVREVRDQIAGFAEPLASGFIAAAIHWQKLAEVLRGETRAKAEHDARPQVFRAGDKILDRASEAFVLRAAVIHELQQQVLLATGCPGIVLYGRRRVGKSSVLANLQGFLPNKIRTAMVSLQNPKAFADLAGLLGELHAAVERALPQAPAPNQPAASGPPLTLGAFYRFLDAANQALARAHEHLILALDEYEQLDSKIGEKVLGEDVLATLRESLQNHRQIIWVLAGSHEISELVHAPWASYLVSARTIEVPMFTLEETRALLTDPLAESPMRPEIKKDRPRFEPEFWGPQGIDGIHAQAGGWPHLVQLVAETLLDLVNRKSLARVDQALFEEGLDLAIVRGHNVLYQLLHKECDSEAEREYLAGFRRADTQPPPAQENVFRALRRRLLVEEVGAAWRLRVPLMLRWLRKRG